MRLFSGIKDEHRQGFLFIEVGGKHGAHSNVLLALYRWLPDISVSNQSATVSTDVHVLQRRAVLQLDMEMQVVYLHSGHVYVHKGFPFCLLITATVKSELCVYL